MILAILHTAAPAAFNRYTLTYTSPIPLRCTVEYNLSGTPRREFCYLEAGEERTFSSYIDAYLNGEAADPGPVVVTAENITAETPPIPEAIHLLGFAAEQVPVLARQTYFIENQRYRVGVELAWGGGLSCLVDKQCPVPGLDNLLNSADTGRLVQQSYYGTRKPPYVPGEFMGQSWCYNPVQGGDRGNFKSKLIDTRVSEGEIYVKCRPRDWGQNGGDTYSYMENTYRLDGDCLVVDNRFVDFSGWEHPVSSQELPAFYTVSYLANYYYYDGDRPWTGDTLSHRDNLPFWPTDWPACTFPVRPGNTETWAAFVDSSLYGLGLYVPDTDRWLAGRHAFDGSMDPKAGSTNYIAPTRHLRLISFKPLTYSYLICAGSLADIRSQFAARRGDIHNRALLTYDRQ